MLFVNNVAQNAMIKIVIKELVNKVNKVKSLSLALAPCNKLLQVRD